MTTLMQHLQERHIDVDLHRPHLDLELDLATFYLWNLSGALVGFQQYRRAGDKKVNNSPREGKYFTYSKQSTVAVWGVESLHLTPHVVFLTEGLFDAARLTEMGYSAVAVFSNDPGTDVRNWLRTLNRKVVAVCDGDKAGAKLAKYADVSLCLLNAKDLGEADDQTVEYLLKHFG